MDKWGTHFVDAAAYLRYMGFEMLEIHDQSGRFTFMFGMTPGLKHAADKFLRGDARVEPRAYSRCYGEVKKAMHRAHEARAATQTRK